MFSFYFKGTRTVFTFILYSFDLTGIYKVSGMLKIEITGKPNNLVLGAIKPKGLNRRAVICQGHICLVIIKIKKNQP
jgi:hypothetical protein